MNIIKFRPYKKYSDEFLLKCIHDMYKRIRRGENLDENMKICDDLIYEAKVRGLECEKDLMYKNILIGDGFF